ncbi:hypothetical protein OESDEN_12440 [Oesophagostomum dentatum]|uniref:Uncharacterized protein n=1 Tax=Oesophagostomum dentatum TaxID=61180 RepID=A0A0B1SV57_OESDE|nr:hypothetical protein OESDEN_12440 [Oesophagostomum dentatum]
MEFDSKFPFEETDPVFENEDRKQKQIQQQKPFKASRSKAAHRDDGSANTVVQAVAQASPTLLEF